MYLKLGKVYRIFALELQISDPNDMEDAISEIKLKLTSIASDIVVDSATTTYQRHPSGINTNVVLKLFLHLSNPGEPDKVRVSKVKEVLDTCSNSKLDSIKID